MERAVILLLCIAVGISVADPITPSPDKLMTVDVDGRTYSVSEMKQDGRSAADSGKSDDKGNQKSSAKPEELNKSRTHQVNLGALDSLLSKLKSTPLTSYVAQPLPQVQPFIPAPIKSVPYWPQWNAPSLSALQSPAPFKGWYPAPVPCPLPHFPPSQTVISHVPQVVQRPVYTVAQQVIHKPVVSEIQETIHKPVVTEITEVVHKPVQLELQQIVKKPLYTQHVLAKPTYEGPITQEYSTGPLHLQSQSYHVVEKPYSQILNLPTQVLPAVQSHVVSVPTVSQVEHSTSPVWPSSGLSWASSSPLAWQNAGLSSLSPLTWQNAGLSSSSPLTWQNAGLSSSSALSWPSNSWWSSWPASSGLTWGAPSALSSGLGWGAAASASWPSASSSASLVSSPSVSYLTESTCRADDPNCIPARSAEPQFEATSFGLNNGPQYFAPSYPAAQNSQIVPNAPYSAMPYAAPTPYAPTQYSYPSFASSNGRSASPKDSFSYSAPYYLGNDGTPTPYGPENSNMKMNPYWKDFGSFNQDADMLNRVSQRLEKEPELVSRLASIIKESEKSSTTQ